METRIRLTYCSLLIQCESRSSNIGNIVMNGCGNRIILHRRNYTTCNKINNGSQNIVTCSGTDENVSGGNNTGNNNFNFSSNFNSSNNFSFNNNSNINNGNMGNNCNFPNFNNIFQNAGFNFSFGSDINSLLSNLINQGQNINHNSTSTINQTLNEENVSETSSNNYNENDVEEEEPVNEEDLIHLKEEIINNFSKFKYKNYVKQKKKRTQE